MYFERLTCYYYISKNIFIAGVYLLWEANVRNDVLVDNNNSERYIVFLVFESGIRIMWILNAFQSENVYWDTCAVII